MSILKKLARRILRVELDAMNTRRLRELDAQFEKFRSETQEIRRLSHRVELAEAVSKAHAEGKEGLEQLIGRLEARNQQQIDFSAMLLARSGSKLDCKSVEDKEGVLAMTVEVTISRAMLTDKRIPAAEFNALAAFVQRQLIDELARLRTAARTPVKPE